MAYNNSRSFEKSPAPQASSVIPSSIADVDIDITQPFGDDTAASTIPSPIPTTVPIIASISAPIPAAVATAVAAAVLILLDPNGVLVPSTPNRLPESFLGEEFEQLRLSVVASGGNVEPILVRLVGDDPPTYHLVFGERRLRACRDAGLKVLAMVAEPGTEVTDYLKRMQENLGRSDLSNWEFGLQVRHMLESAPTMTRSDLAFKLGVSVSSVSRAYDLGRLPDVIVGAFQSPNQIRFQDMKPLRDAWASHPEAVAQEAALIRQESEPLRGPDVVRRLSKAAKTGTAEADSGFAPCKPSSTGGIPKPMVCGDIQIGQSVISSQGTLELRIDIAMSQAQRTALLDLVIGFAQRKVLVTPKAKTAKTAKTDSADVAANPGIAAIVDTVLPMM